MKDSPGQAGAGTKPSLQGCFLVAAPHQPDPNFAETVILVVEHTRRGAFGVILNCPREQAEQMHGQWSAQRHDPEQARTYFGGPVTGPLMALHGEASLAEVQLLPGVFFSGREENVLALMRETEQPYKIFTGYAGWGPRQIECEVEHGMWWVIPATTEQIFSPSDDLWQELSQQAFHSRLRGMFNLKHIPADPLLN